METTIVRYRVKADKADENKAYIRRVFEELDASIDEFLAKWPASSSPITHRDIRQMSSLEPLDSRRARSAQGERVRGTPVKRGRVASLGGSCACDKPFDPIELSNGVPADF